jgi:tRNA(fMet)-specific endonuclease VapC
VLDTNIVSALMCREEQALAHARQFQPKALILTSVVMAEVNYGIERLAKRSKRRHLLERELRRLQSVLGWADWDEGSAVKFGQIKAGLEKAGRRLDDSDIAIAASSLALQAKVVTRNQKHLSRVRGLEVEGW